jgi:peptidyl-prolyl cis-trans isomerase SurA
MYIKIIIISFIFYFVNGPSWSKENLSNSLLAELSFAKKLQSPSELELEKKPDKNNITIIARIKDKIITDLDLENRYLISNFLTKIEKKSQKQEKILKNQLLQQMIIEKLYLLEAEKYKIKFTKDEINKNLKNFAINYDLNIDKIKKYLKKFNILYEDYLSQIKSQMILNIIIKEQISPKINITNSQINEILEIYNIKSQLVSNFIYEIYINDNIKNSQEISDIIFSELQSGGDFKKLAMEFSNSNSGQSGGEVGWLDESELEEEFYDVIKNLKIDKISKPIFIDDGYYIFKITDQRIVPNENITNIEKIKKSLFSQKLQINIKKYINKLREDYNIVIYD